ncbi:MAG: glutaminase A [Nitriliruptoraceae bacterium]
MSTGTLPVASQVRQRLLDAHERFRTVTDGRVSRVYPALAEADPDRFGLAVASVTGTVHAVGDTGVRFAIMSAVKPFVHALACEHHTAPTVRRRIGANATGEPFNGAGAVERAPDGRTNPMVNAGAIATVALLPGAGLEDRWGRLRAALSRFAAEALDLDEEVYRSAAASNQRNRSLAWLLDSLGALDADPMETVELYTRACCLAVTVRDLAVMGAVLADGGVQPVTAERVVGPAACRETLAAMITAGMYEASGEWLCEVGLPAKSGIAGGIVTVSPGKGALATFSPRLDEAGNSVRGTLAARSVSRTLGLDLLASMSARTDAVEPSRTATGSPPHLPAERRSP